MRRSAFSLLAASSALLTLTAAAPALAAPGEGEPDVTITEITEPRPVKVVETTEANGDTTKTVIVGAAAAPVVKVVETTEADGDTKKVVIVEAKADEAKHEIVEEIVEEHHHHRDREIKWLGLHAGAIFAPGGGTGRVGSGQQRLRQNQFKACADPAGTTACGYIQGLDLKVQMFETDSAWRYPRFVGYFRTGFEQGRVHVEAGPEGFAPGQATRVDYTSVPLFLGGSVYLFDEFPVRPYGGLGFGFDVLRLDYRRADGEGRRTEQARLVDASARIGFELHAGLEVRISNYISLNAEVMQLWSARRKLPALPDYSNTGLSVLAGVTVGIPVRLDRRGNGEHHTKTIRKIRRVVHD
jgi:hypothetical protein